MADKKKLEKEKQQLRTCARELRSKLKDQKKKNLDLKSNFVLQKLELKTKIRVMKNKITELENELKNVMADDIDFFVDPETGVIDMTKPQTPPQPKRNKPVSLDKCKKKLKL